MKLKKMLAALTSAALAISTMAFTPLTASATGVSLVYGDGDGVEVANISLDKWGSQWVKCYDSSLQTINFDDYCIEFTVETTGGPGWDGYEFFKVDETMYTAKNSDTEVVIQHPMADITLDAYNGFGFNVQAGQVPVTLVSATIEPYTPPTAPNLPEFEYSMGSGTSTNYGQAVVGCVNETLGAQYGEEKCVVTNAALAGNFVVSAAFTSDKNPELILQGNNEDHGWVKVSPTIVLDGTAYWTKDDVVAAYGSDFSDTYHLCIGDTGADLTVSKSAVYSDVSPKAPTTIKLDKTTADVNVGESVTVEATVSDDTTVVWTSSDESIATVVDGVVTGVAVGEATITATAGEASASCVVTVKAAPVNSIDVTADAKELYTGETTQATATRDGKAVSVTWKSSDEKIATVDEKGVITAVGKGTVTITATPEDGSPASVVIKVKEAGQEQKVEQFVDRLYNTLLGRTPDEHSADHKNDLLADKTACDVARNFVLSEEFLNMGLTNEEVVDKMYMTFLGRPADEAGKADWVNRLNNGCSYAHVFYGFTQCNEFAEICADYGIKVGTYKVESPRDVNCNLTAFVTRLYGKVLGRTYDVPGLDNHTAKYLKTGDIYAMAYDFIFSPEFTEKELTNEEFVEIMYQTFFNRGSDPEGKAHWLEVLAGEGTREDVLKGFVGSQECAELVESFKI